MAKISIDAVRPWLAALYDRLPAVRRAALRLLVHLPLDDSGWIELGALLQKWLKTFNPTANLPAQSIHGFSFWELADSGRWIPAPELRAVFHRLLPDLGTVDQSRLAGLLAQAGDQESLEAILNQIGVEDQSDWSYIAESLSFGDIARWTDKVEAIFRQHPVPDSRFWLAVALAKSGRTGALEEIFAEIHHDTLSARFLENLSGPAAETFVNYLSLRNPMPVKTRAFLQGWVSTAQGAAGAPAETINKIAAGLAGDAEPEPPGVSTLVELAIAMGDELNPATPPLQRLAATGAIERALLDSRMVFPLPFHPLILPREESSIPKGGLEGEFEMVGGFPMPDFSFEAGMDSQRVVNTGFTTETDAEHSLAKALTLQTGQAYYFTFDIDWPDAGSIETTPAPIPNLPPQTTLTITLVGFQDGLLVDPQASIGELVTHPGGAVSVASQPLGDRAPRTARSDRRLYFPVRTPAAPGVYRMRCNLYWNQLLLQSRLVTAHVQVRPTQLEGGEPALRSDLVDYRLASPGGEQLTAFVPHTLSLLLNANGDGTHSIHLYGADGALRIKHDDIRFEAGELQGMIEQARGALNLVAWGDAGDWKDQPFKYQHSSQEYQNRQIKIARLAADLSNLARWGRNFYLQIRTRLVGSQLGLSAAQIKQARKDFAELTRLPGFFQIALKESPSFILPAALIYDYPLDAGQASDFTLCSTFRSALEQRQPLADCACFRGECPNREVPTSVCPSGFWGYRHYLGVPLSLEYASDAPADIPYGNRPTVVMGEYQDFNKLVEHRQNLQKLPLDLIAEQDRTRLIEQLRSAGPHLVYFYCHGGLVRGAPYLVIGSDQHKGILDRPSLDANDILWGDPVRPLVILNGCRTSAVEPLAGLNLIEGFIVDSQAAGLIGTEITIYEELARDFAQELFAHLLKEEPVGRAVLAARLAILAQGNPLGLVYTPFVQAGLHLRKST